MNVCIRILVSASILCSFLLAGTLPCKETKQGVTVCDPYAVSFLEVKNLKKRIKRPKRHLVSKRVMQITDRIKVKNGITLHNLITKYIKREERLYSQAELQRRYMEPYLQHGPREIFLKKRDKSKEILPEKKGLQEMTEKLAAAEKTPERVEIDEDRVPFVESDSTPIETKENNLTTAIDKNITADQNITTVERKLPKIEYATYTVQKGEGIISIAKKFNIDRATLFEINNISPKEHIKIGQKIKIPMSQDIVDAINIAFYIVKKGDSLSSIAKKFGVKLSDLKKYNKIRKKSVIHVGQGLVLPVPHKLKELKRKEEQKRKERLRKKRERERLARIALKKKERERFLRISKGLKRKLSVTATAYTSHRSQTDRTPFLAAWNNRIRPGMKVIAVSRDLIYKYGITNGTKVRISGLPGIYTVRDKMNKKWRRRIDIYMGMNRYRALKWGKRRVTIYY